jgi:hypothetical protein
MRSCTWTRLFAMLFSASCTAQSLPTSPDLDSQSRPRPIEGPQEYVPSIGPPFKLRRPLKAALPKTLPHQARMHPPTFDGDSFIVVVPNASNSSTPDAVRLFKNVALPAFRAAGLRFDEREFAGNEISPASLSLEEREHSQKLRGARTGQWIFTQRINGVPIEHRAVFLSVAAGQREFIFRGSLQSDRTIANQVRLSPEAAVEAGRTYLDRVFQEKEAWRKYRTTVGQHADVPALVLLPYGSARDHSGVEVNTLRYAYRTTMFGKHSSTEFTLAWRVWLDAEDGRVLVLNPQFAEAIAAARIYPQNPSRPSGLGYFEVSDAAGGQYTLADAHVLRIDRLGDGTFGQEVSIASDSQGSTASFANFDQAPLNDAAASWCANSGNTTFRQINLFYHLQRYRRMVVDAGAMPVFPAHPVTVWIDGPGDSNIASYSYFGEARSLLRFNIGRATEALDCPDSESWSVGSLSGALDSTVIAHEFAHLSVPRILDMRPVDYCGTPPCPLPDSNARYIFHDYADAMASFYADTPCFAGWIDKNVGGPNRSLNCRADTSFGSGAPRLGLAERVWPYSDTYDVFPWSTLGGHNDYNLGQLATAALWAVRQRLISKEPAMGRGHFMQRLNRAFWHYGFEQRTCTSWESYRECERDAYRYLRDLEIQLMAEWSAAGTPGGAPSSSNDGPDVSNKVASGFATAGIFLIPQACIDGLSATSDAYFCPPSEGGEDGGDAIVEARDNDFSDDPATGFSDDPWNGLITSPEWDYVKRTGNRPSFWVWTGPRYIFSGEEASSFIPSATTPAPCNAQFEVELASDSLFTVNVVRSTSAGVWRTVSRTYEDGCQAGWSPSNESWVQLRGDTGASSRIYYRVRTRDARGCPQLSQGEKLPRRSGREQQFVCTGTNSATPSGPRS